MSTIGNYTWHKVADTIEEIHFSSNGLAEISVAGKTICIAGQGGELFACTQRCPHAGGFMSQGHLDGNGNIVCPLHRYKFSLKNGRDVSGEGYFLKIFPVRIQKAGIFVGIAENSFFNWLK